MMPLTVQYNCIRGCPTKSYVVPSPIKIVHNPHRKLPGFAGANVKPTAVPRSVTIRFKTRPSGHEMNSPIGPRNGGGQFKSLSRVYPATFRVISRRWIEQDATVEKGSVGQNQRGGILVETVWGKNVCRAKGCSIVPVPTLVIGVPVEWIIRHKSVGEEGLGLDLGRNCRSDGE